jgi:autotransporter-associated beta strand protein
VVVNSGTVTFDAVKSYTGGTVVNSGVLALTASGSGATGLIRGNLDINAGATVVANNTTRREGTLDGSNRTGVSH